MVHVARKKQDSILEPKTWADFTTSGTDYRQSQGIFLGKLELTVGNPDDEVLIFGKKGAIEDLKDANMINVHVIRDVNTKFTSNVCVIHKIAGNKVRICIIFYSYRVGLLG